MSRQYNNHGRDQINIENWGTVIVHRQSERSRNELNMLRAIKGNIASRLASSLHNDEFINVGKEVQPDQVKRPWDREIKIGVKAATEIPDDMTISQVFEAPEINGKLLILGQPGAGKTTTLLHLAKTLVEKAEEDSSYPIPILFNLSSWKDEKQSIRDWMVGELRSKYGVSSKWGQQWVMERIVLPLLDGLDEVAPGRQEICVKRINELLEGESAPLYTVVCSRITEYENYETPLHLGGAVYVQKLGNLQIEDYLTKLERSDLWQFVARNTTLLELVRTPFFLNIAVIIYPKGEAEQWQNFQIYTHQIQDFLDAYVERMLHRDLENYAYIKQSIPSNRQTHKWLTCLAKSMEQTHETEFLIEGMQYYMLPVNKQETYEIGSRLIAILGLWLLSGLSSVILYQNYMGWNYVAWGDLSSNHWSSNLLSVIFMVVIFGLPWGLFIGVFIPFKPEIKSVEILKFSWANFAKGTLHGFCDAPYKVYIGLYILTPFLVGQILVSLFNQLSKISAWITPDKLQWSAILDIAKEFLSSSLLSEILSFLAVTLTIWLVYGINVGIMCGFVPDSVKVKCQPNQGIRYSAINYLISVLIYILSTSIIVGSLSYCLVNQSVNGLINGLINGLALGLAISPFFALGTGGRASIQHLLLRLLLCRNNCIPWNYSRFLDYATERFFLQRVGGGYRFVNELLQKHFASMPGTR